MYPSAIGIGSCPKPPIPGHPSIVHISAPVLASMHLTCSPFHGGVFGERTELIFAVLCGVLLLIGWLLETFGQVSPWLPISCYVVSYFFGGYFTLSEAIEKLLSGRFEIDFLMLVAAAGAAAWPSGRA